MKTATPASPSARLPKRTDMRVRPKQVDTVRLFCVCGVPLTLGLTHHRTVGAIATWHRFCTACRRHVYLEVTGA